MFLCFMLLYEIILEKTTIELALDLSDC